MKNSFKKAEFNEEFNHEDKIVSLFNSLGFNDFKITTSLTNGCSHYISLCVKVLNESKCYSEMFILNGMAFIEVRVSDHSSNLTVSGDRMTLDAFKHLLLTGAIATQI